MQKINVLLCITSLVNHHQFSKHHQF